MTTLIFCMLTKKKKALITSTAGIVSGHTEAIEDLQDKIKQIKILTKLSGYGITRCLHKTEINNKISAVFRYKG